jgi:hypothetical protein
MAIGITPEEARELGVSYEDASTTSRNVTQQVATDKAYNTISNYEMENIDNAIATYAGTTTEPLDAMEFIALDKEQAQPLIAETSLVEEAFYATRLRSVTDSTADIMGDYDFFHKVKDDLIATGSSPELAQVYKELTSLTPELDRAAMMSILEDQTIPQNIKEQSFKTFQQKGGELLDLRQEYVNATAALESIEADREKRRSAPLDLTFLQERLEWNQERTNEINAVASQLDPSVSSFWLGVGEIIIPFVDQVYVQSLKDKVLGEGGVASDVAGAILFGENKQQIREAIRKMPFDQRKVAVRAMIEAVSQLPGGDYKKMMYLSTLTDTGEYATWERAIDNIVGVLDTLTVAGLLGKAIVKTGATLLRTHPASAIETARIASRAEAARLATAALMEATGDAAKSMGTNKVEVANTYLLPKMSDEVLNDLPTDVVQRLNEIETRHAGIYDNLRTSGINYTDAEKVAALQQTTRDIAEVQGMHLRMESTTLSTDGESLFGTAMYGKTSEKSFDSAEAAAKAALDSGIPIEEVSFFVRNAKTGELDRVPLTAGELTEKGAIPTSRALFGGPKGRGFGTASEAAEWAAASGKNPRDLQVMERLPTGEMKPIPLSLGEITSSVLTRAEMAAGAGPARTGKFFVEESRFSLASVPKGSEFYIGRTFSRPFDLRDAAIFGGDSISRVAKIQGANYLADITSKFDNWFARAALKAADNATAIEKQFLDIVRKDVSSLKRGQKADLFKALEQGSTDAVTYTRTDLATKFGLDEGTIRAYYTYRKMQDLSWFQTNRTFRKKLEGMGMKEVKGVSSVDGRQFAAPLTREQASSVTHVYDAKQSKVVQVTKEYLDEMYAAGNSLGKMHSPIKTLDSRTSHVLIDNKTTTLGRLPDSPLPYIDGYYQRSYRENYFLVKVPKNGIMVDGKFINDPVILEAKYGSAVRTGTSMGVLKGKVKELNANLAANADYYYRVRRANEFDDVDVAELQLRKSYQNASRGRGVHLEGQIDNSLAAIADPMESLFNNIRTMSKYVATDDFMASSQQRWVNTWGKATGGKYPLNFKDVAKGRLTDDEYASARAVHQQLEMMNMATSKTDAIWRNFMLAASETLDGRSLMLADMTRGLSEISPVGAVRSVSSTLFIALRPIRQLVIQPAQLMQLAFVSPLYYASGRASRELLALSLSRATWGNVDLTAKVNDIGAKLFGTTPKEYETIAKHYYDKSGLPYSIDSHMYIDGIVKDIHASHLDSGLKRAVSTALAPGRAVVGFSKKIGFDTGEFINLTGSWLTARDRWMKANPTIATKWAEKQYADVIDADARALSYAMTQPGSFAYQQGLLSVPLQFLSVPHKALLSVLPAAWGGSRTLTGIEKAGIAAGNLIMFGGVGFGIDSALQTVLETTGAVLTEEASMGIRGGLMDLAMNSLLRTLSDDENDGTAIKFSDSFSPISDKVIPGAEILTHLLDGEVSALMGPSFHALGRFNEVFNDIKVITAKPDASTPEKIVQTMASVASLASGFNDGIKTMIAMNAKVLVSKSGDAVVEATYLEAMGKMFGLQTYAEVATWDMARKLGDRNQLAKDWAALLHANYSKQRLAQGSTKADFMELVSRYKALENLVDPDILPLAYKELVKLETRSLSTTQDSMLNWLINDAMNGPEARQKAIDYINGSSNSQEIKDDMIKILELGIK